MNVKAGDLAVIIKSVDGTNVGKRVEVMFFQGEHSKFGPIWHVRSRGPQLITEYGAKGPECDCADSWLRPLLPEGLPMAANDAISLPDRANRHEDDRRIMVAQGI